MNVSIRHCIFSVAVTYDVEKDKRGVPQERNEAKWQDIILKADSLVKRKILMH